MPKIIEPSKRSMLEYNIKASKIVNNYEDEIEKLQEEFIDGLGLTYNKHSAILRVLNNVSCPSAETLFEVAQKGQLA